jgi:hypothetical protein
VDTTWRSIIWSQFGAAIDMLENALLACPNELWGGRSRRPEFWHLVYHTLFFLDLYLSDSVEGFNPPLPLRWTRWTQRGRFPIRPPAGWLGRNANSVPNEHLGVGTT